MPHPVLRNEHIPYLGLFPQRAEVVAESAKLHLRIELRAESRSSFQNNIVLYETKFGSIIDSSRAHEENSGWRN